jgi:hypothetical protein
MKKTLTPNLSPAIPPEVLAHFDQHLQKIQPLIRDFLGYHTRLQITLDGDPELKTFAFAPATNTILVPLKWYQNFLSGEALHTEELLKFILLHEGGHYRDKLKEQEIAGVSAMLACLTSLREKKITLSPIIAIPIGEMIHELYNCIDDVVVNTDVMKYKAAQTSPDFLSTTYQTYNCPVYREKAAGETPTPDTTSPIVEMKKKSLPSLFARHFLRDKMVKGQKLYLPPQIHDILYSDQGSQRSRKSSLQQTHHILKQAWETTKTQKNLTPKKQARLKQLEIPYMLHLQHLEMLLSHPQDIVDILLTSGLKVLPGYQKGLLSATTLSLDSLVSLFTQTKGIDDNHRMYILPAQRYRIIQAIFEPIVESLIFLELLQSDEPPKEKGSGKKEKGSGEGSGDGGVFEKPLDPSLENDIDTLKGLLEKKKAEALAREQAKTTYPLEALFNTPDLTPSDVTFYQEVKKNFMPQTVALAEFLYHQLEHIDRKEQTEIVPTKRGKFDIATANKAIANDPL